MDQNPLVVDDIEAGREFIRQMNQFMPVKAAYWLRSSEDAERYLVVALDGLTDVGINTAYREVTRVAKDMQEHYVDPFRVKVISAEDPAARAVQELYKRTGGRSPRLSGSSLGGEPVVEIYIYPQLKSVGSATEQI